MKVPLQPDPRGFIHSLVVGIVSSGWAVEGLPSQGRLLANRQPIVLHADGQAHNFLLHVYKVTGSSRNRPEERRIEITTTYPGLNPNQFTVQGYEDVVVGYDPDAECFVGFDHRRLFEGGATHNASSFFDGAALTIPKDGLEVVPFESALFGVEYHVFFAAARAADYLLHARQLHQGGTAAVSTSQYRRPAGTTGALSVSHEHAIGNEVHLVARTNDSVQPATWYRDVERIEAGRPPRRLTPRQLDGVLARCQENGRLGEQLVYGSERERLRACGRADLAERVVWVSLSNVAAGFDVLVPEEDGHDHFVEVKATQGSAMTFPMSEGEWRKAEQARERFWIARVTEVRSDEPRIWWFRDPVGMEADGLLTRSWDGFQVTVQGW
jgi:hypothetical protein